MLVLLLYAVGASAVWVLDKPPWYCDSECRNTFSKVKLHTSSEGCLTSKDVGDHVFEMLSMNGSAKCTGSQHPFLSFCVRDINGTLLVANCNVRTIDYRIPCRGTKDPMSWYRGIHSITVTGKSCLRWDSVSTVVTESQFDEADAPSITHGSWGTLSKGVHAHENYCRNPDESPKGPWCFVKGEDGNETAEQCFEDCWRYTEHEMCLAKMFFPYSVPFASHVPNLPTVKGSPGSFLDLSDMLDAPRISHFHRLNRAMFQPTLYQDHIRHHPADISTRHRCYQTGIQHRIAGPWTYSATTRHPYPKYDVWLEEALKANGAETMERERAARGDTGPYYSLWRPCFLACEDTNIECWPVKQDVFDRPRFKYHGPKNYDAEGHKCVSPNYAYQVLTVLNRRVKLNEHSATLLKVLRDEIINIDGSKKRLRNNFVIFQGNRMVSRRCFVLGDFLVGIDNGARKELAAKNSELQSIMSIGAGCFVEINIRETEDDESNPLLQPLDIPALFSTVHASDPGFGTLQPVIIILLSAISIIAVGWTVLYTLNSDPMVALRGVCTGTLRFFMRLPPLKSSNVDEEPGPGSGSQKEAESGATVSKNPDSSDQPRSVASAMPEEASSSKMESSKVDSDVEQEEPKSKVALSMANHVDMDVDSKAEQDAGATERTGAGTVQKSQTGLTVAQKVGQLAKPAAGAAVLAAVGQFVKRRFDSSAVTKPAVPALPQPVATSKPKAGQLIIPQPGQGKSVQNLTPQGQGKPVQLMTPKPGQLMATQPGQGKPVPFMTLQPGQGKPGLLMTPQPGQLMATQPGQGKPGQLMTPHPGQGKLGQAHPAQPMVPRPDQPKPCQRMAPQPGPSKPDQAMVPQPGQLKPNQLVTPQFGQPKPGPPKPGQLMTPQPFQSKPGQIVTPQPYQPKPDQHITPQPNQSKPSPFMTPQVSQPKPGHIVALQPGQLKPGQLMTPQAGQSKPGPFFSPQPNIGQPKPGQFMNPQPGPPKPVQLTTPKPGQLTAPKPGQPHTVQLTTPKLGQQKLGQAMVPKPAQLMTPQPVQMKPGQPMTPGVGAIVKPKPGPSTTPQLVPSARPKQPPPAKPEQNHWV